MDSNFVSGARSLIKSLSSLSAPIPWLREHRRKTRPPLKHLGLYVSPHAAARLPHPAQGELERIEQLEQLRWLERLLEDSRRGGRARRNQRRQSRIRRPSLESLAHTSHRHACNPGLCNAGRSPPAVRQVPRSRGPFHRAGERLQLLFTLRLNEICPKAGTRRSPQSSVAVLPPPAVSGRISDIRLDET